MMDTRRPSWNWELRTMVTNRLSENRWALVARGVVAIIFAIAAIAAPAAMAGALVWVIGAYALVDGVFALIAAIRFAHEHERWLPMLAHGILGILFGLFLFAYPLSGLTAICIVAGIWAIVTGVTEFLAGLRLRNHAAGEFLLLVAGSFSIIVGLLLIFHPLTTAVAYVWVLGIYSLIAGVSLLIQAARLGRIGGSGVAGGGTTMP